MLGLLIDFPSKIQQIFLLDILVLEQTLFLFELYFSLNESLKIQIYKCIPPIKLLCILTQAREIVIANIV